MTTIKNIHLRDNGFIITDDLPGVYCHGIQYYDLIHIRFLNNTDLANLISLLKSLLETGTEVRFVNMNDQIKNKIKIMGLDLLIYSEELQNT